MAIRARKPSNETPNGFTPARAGIEENEENPSKTARRRRRRHTYYYLVLCSKVVACLYYLRTPRQKWLCVITLH